MPLPSFDHLFAAADQRSRRIRVAAAGAADRTVLEAVSLAQPRGWSEPILIGSAHEIKQCAEDAGLSLAGMRIVDSEQPGAAAVTEVRAGRADTLMKGQINTPELIRAVLNAAILSLKTQLAFTDSDAVPDDQAAVMNAQLAILEPRLAQLIKRGLDSFEFETLT